MSKAPKTALASHIYDHTIENMIYMQEQGRKEVRLSKAMTRPAYAYTRAEQKQILCEGDVVQMFLPDELFGEKIVSTELLTIKPIINIIYEDKLYYQGKQFFQHLLNQKNNP